MSSDVVPRGTARPNFYDLGFGLATYGLGLEGPDLGPENCINSYTSW